MSGRPGGPEGRVRALWRRVAAGLVIEGVAGAGVAVGTTLLLAWLAGRVGILERPTPWPLILWLGGSAALASWLWVSARRIGRWNQAAAAGEIERAAELPMGSLRGAVEPGLEAPGTSWELVRLHRERLAEALQGLPTSALGDRIARAAARGALVAGVLAVALAAVLAAISTSTPASAQQAWTALLRPMRSLSAPPLPPLILRADTTRIRRGQDLPVHVTAPARDSVALFWQPQGEPPRESWLALTAEEASAAVPNIESATRFWLRAVDGASSDTLRVTPVDPLLLLDVEVTLRYPAYTGRELEILSSPLPRLTVPTGTRATVRAKTTRPVLDARLRSGEGEIIDFEMFEGRRFQSSFRVRPGVWAWDITGEDGDSLEGPADVLAFATVPDSIPSVAILFPGVDTVLSPSMTQPLVIDIRDDYGLSAAELVSWRISAWGERWPETVDRLDVSDGGARANLSTILDARGRSLLPGDTLRYVVRAYDNAPEPQMGRSREFVLRLPDLDELRERTLTRSDDLVEAARELAEKAEQHEQATEALQRNAEPRPNAGGSGLNPEKDEGLQFRDVEEARRALEKADELMEDAQRIQRQLGELQEAIRRAGLEGESVLERLREIESLYQRILTPELSEKLEALREALTELDPERMREAINELAESSRDFRQRVEQSVELLQRAAVEQEFETLETQADELAQKHEELAESADRTEAAERAEGDAGEKAEADSLAEAASQRAQILAERSESLAERIDEFSQELDELRELEAGERADEAGEASELASLSDRQTARQMSGDRPQAARSARRAQQQMQQAASSLQQGRQGMQEGWRQEVVQALDQARTEALELARRQRELNSQMNADSPAEQGRVRSDQVAMRRALDQLQDQLDEAMESTLLIEPGLLGAVSAVQAAMDQLLTQMGDGAQQGRVSPGSGGRASEALTELAYRLMQASDDASAAASGTGLQEALERLAQLAEQQGELNSQSSGLSPSGLAEALMQQMRQLGGQQRDIAGQLQQLDESLGPRSQVLGELDELSREASDIAEDLETGRLDQEVIERQRELFQKLLDAGRTLEQDEFERERRAERPTGTETLNPGPLPPELLQGRQFPHPGVEALRAYPPAFRQLIMEYFDRLNGTQGSGDGS